MLMLIAWKIKRVLKSLNNLNTSHVNVNRQMAEESKEEKANLNTSHVNFNLCSFNYYSCSITYLNTSHVNVNQI